MKKHNGFTFIEMLFVIFILTIFIGLTVPITMKGIEQHQTNQFFTVLTSDILLLQNQSFGVVTNRRLVFEDEQYLIRGENGILERRQYPNHLQYNSQSNNEIQFKNTGTVIHPTTYRFYDQDT